LTTNILNFINDICRNARFTRIKVFFLFVCLFVSLLRSLTKDCVLCQDDKCVCSKTINACVQPLVLLFVLYFINNEFYQDDVFESSFGNCFGRGEKP